MYLLDIVASLLEAYRVFQEVGSAVCVWRTVQGGGSLKIFGGRMDKGKPSGTARIVGALYQSAGGILVGVFPGASGRHLQGSNMGFVAYLCTALLLGCADGAGHGLQGIIFAGQSHGTSRV